MRAVLGDSNVTKRSAMHLDLKDEMWSLMEEILPTLNLLKIANTLVCGEKYVTISDVLSIVVALFDKFSNDSEDDSAVLKDFKNALITGLNTRFINKIEESNNLYLKAMAVDPRFKDINFFFVTFELRQKIYADIREEIKSNKNREQPHLDTEYKNAEVGEEEKEKQRCEEKMKTKSNKK